jgi:hypothetical protein
VNLTEFVESVENQLNMVEMSLKLYKVDRSPFNMSM